MAAQLIQQVPKEFGDDERWFKFLNNRSLIVIIGGGFIALFMGKTFSALFGLFWLGIVLGLILTGAALFLVNVKVAKEDAVLGGGMTKGSILYNKACMKHNARLHVKVYRREREDVQ